MPKKRKSQRIEARTESTGLFRNTTVSANLMVDGEWDEEAELALERAAASWPSNIDQLLEHYERAANDTIKQHGQPLVPEGGTMAPHIQAALGALHDAKLVRKAIEDGDPREAAWWTFKLVGGKIVAALRPAEKLVQTGRKYRQASRRGRQMRTRRDAERHAKYLKDAKTLKSKRPELTVSAIARHLSSRYEGTPDAAKDVTIRRVIGKSLKKLISK